MISDTTQVGPGLKLIFKSTDSNNPNWHILALVKYVRERLGVAIEEVSEQTPREIDDVPF
jgi:hypothetical protein